MGWEKENQCLQKFPNLSVKVREQPSSSSPPSPPAACHRHLREPIHQTTWKRPRGARSNLSRQTRRPVLLSSKAQLQPPQAWERREEMMHGTKDAAREISLPGQAQEACSGARTKREQLGPPRRPRREITTGPVPGIVLQARHLAGQNILGKHERVR